MHYISTQTQFIIRYTEMIIYHFNFQTNLGGMKNELDDGDYINKFVALGPKTLASKTNKRTY